MRRIFLVQLMLFLVWPTVSRAAPFAPGEVLEFDASWGVIPAAKVSAEVLGLPGQPRRMRLIGRCVSVGVVEAFYPVRSTMESRVITSRGIPERSCSLYEDRREGSRRLHRYTYLDFSAGYGFWANYVSGHVKRLRLNAAAWDTVALTYHVRSLDWDVGQVRKLSLFVDGKYETVTVRAAAPRTASIGVWRGCPVLELVSDDLMEQAAKRRGKLRAIVTRDERHLPLEVRMELSWGTVRLDLVRAAGVTGKPLAQK